MIAAWTDKIDEPEEKMEEKKRVRSQASVNMIVVGLGDPLRNKPSGAKRVNGISPY